MPQERSIDLADFIRREQSTILLRWEARVRSASEVARPLARPQLVDAMPDLLEAIATNAALPALSLGGPTGASSRHALTRLQQGYDLAEVVIEYIELRACIFERLEELGLIIEPKQSRRLHRELDHAVRETSQRFLERQEKMIRAMDWLDSYRVPYRSLDETLAGIAHALHEAAGANVDSVAILLLEEDGLLHLRASLGLDDSDAGFTLAAEDGFAWRVLEAAKPLLLRDAADDTRVLGHTARKAGIRALYGVPLRDEQQTIGVAWVGSSSAFGFSEDDLMLFRAMCERATTAIVRARFVDALERTSRFREQFIAILGHDLRSPLSTILGTAHLLLQDKDASARMRAWHERIARSATRMNVLITQLLDFTRARLGGGFTLTKAPLSLLPLVRDVADEQVPLLSRRSLSVEGEDIRGEWDRDRLAQAIANLVGNAVNHSPDGSRIRVDVRGEGADGAAIEIWNEGPPIPESTKLFEPFERATRGGAGLGLGLYITHEIVRAHGGKLDVRSDEAGTSFTIRLPVT